MCLLSSLPTYDGSSPPSLPDWGGGGEGRGQYGHAINGHGQAGNNKENF